MKIRPPTPFPFLSLSLSLSLSLRHLGFTTTATELEVRKAAMPTMEKGRRRRIRVSFGRVSSSSPGFTCFTSLRSLFTHGMITTTTTVIKMYVAIASYLMREGGRKGEREPKRSRERERERDGGWEGDWEKVWRWRGERKRKFTKGLVIHLLFEYFLGGH